MNKNLVRAIALLAIMITDMSKGHRRVLKAREWVLWLCGENKLLEKLDAVCARAEENGEYDEEQMIAIPGEGELTFGIRTPWRLQGWRKYNGMDIPEFIYEEKTE